MVHTSIWASGQFSRLSRDAGLLYIGIITLGDDDGRLKGSPALIRSQVFPYSDDVKVADVAKWLAEIEREKLVIRYEVEGEAYYFHPKWEDYQNIREDRRRESHIPAPDFEFAPVSTKRQPSGNQKSGKAPLNISKDNKTKDNINQDVAFVGFWDAYPKKVGKKAAWKAWQRLEGLDAALLSAVMAGLERAKASEQWAKDGGRYVPHAATWLNGERWEDEHKPLVAKNKKYEHVGTDARA